MGVSNAVNPSTRLTRTTNSFDALAMITIRVGKEPEHKDFIAHESFLTSRSEFFRRALNGNWKEAETRTISLPDDDHRIFDIYMNFVYTGQFITTRKSQEEHSSLDFRTWCTFMVKEYDDMFCVYVLAEKFQDIATKNTVIAALIEMMHLEHKEDGWTCPSFRTTKKVFEGTLEGSPARRLIVDMLSTNPLDHTIRKFVCLNLHPDLLVDLGKKLVETHQLRGGISGNIAAANRVEKYLEAT
jgi:hypothetical protein